MKYFLTITCLCLALLGQAQTGTVKGLVLRQPGGGPLNEASVLLPAAKMITSTNEQGAFELDMVPYGTYTLRVSADGYTEEEVEIDVHSALTEVPVIKLSEGTTSEQNQMADQSAVSEETATSEDQNNTPLSGQNVSSALNASRDAYLSAATFNWGPYFYRMRGYEPDEHTLYLNGVPMNDLEEGGVFYNALSGLNDIFRGRTVSLGLAPVDYSFGSLGLNTQLDASASNQRKGTRLTYTLTNRAYRDRIMLTHSSGIQKNGWSYAFSFSRRWAREGVVPGTSYDAWGYYGAIEKQWKNQHLSLTIIGAPTRRAKAGPATQEVFDLAGSHYYNPYWGYQDGQVRNSRIVKTHMPLFVLTHETTLSERTHLSTSIGYQTGYTSQTGLDWQNASDPRPDYYRYLPSYQDSASQREAVTEAIKANPGLLQIHWDSLYEANRNNVAAGYNNSVYIVNAAVEKTRRLQIGIHASTVLGTHITLHNGLNIQSQNNRYFERVEDLMDGLYFNNINTFAARTFGGIIKNADRLNLLDASVQKKVGDTYGYDYTIHHNKASWFSQLVFAYNKLDFYLAAELGFTGFYRTGHFLSGLYINDSYGNSATPSFFNPKAKGGLTYKINGRNYLYANGAIGNRAPLADNIFISPRTRNEMIANPVNERFYSMEAGYLLRAPTVKARLTFFATDIKNACEIKHYYSEIDYSFVSMAMQGIGKRYTGIEAGGEIKVSPSFNINLAAALTQAFYTTRPYIDLYSDNEVGPTNSTLNGARDTVYMKNYYLPSGPQTALMASVHYNSKKYWYATLSANYLARNWMDFAPTARTRDAVDNLVKDSEAWHAVVDQKKLPDAFTMDLYGGKSFRVNKYIKKAGNQAMLIFTAGISNLLNNKNIKLYGFENLRFDKEDPSLFGPKFGYALGRQYFINLSLRF